MKKSVKYIVAFMSLLFLFLFVYSAFAEDITAVGKSRGKYIYKIGNVFVAVSEGDILDGCLVSSSGLICDNNLKLEIESQDYCAKHIEEAIENKDCSEEAASAVKSARQEFDNRLRREMMKANENCANRLAAASAKLSECSAKLSESEKKIAEQKNSGNTYSQSFDSLASDKDYKIKALKEALRRCWNRVNNN